MTTRKTSKTKVKNGKKSSLKYKIEVLSFRASREALTDTHQDVNLTSDDGLKAKKKNAKLLNAITPTPNAKRQNAN